MESFAELGPLTRDASRWRSLGALFTLAAASGLTAALVACGGGGGGDGSTPSPSPPPAPPPPVASPMPIAAQLTVPTPVGYDADRLAAFNRLNEIRLSAGLGMLAQNTEMDQAAQAHAGWMVTNNSFVHGEVAGTPGFTGTNWEQRDEAFGYVPIEGSEVMAQGAASASVDVLVNSAYHRAALLAFEPVDVGVGWSSASAANVTTPLVIDLTKPGYDTVRGAGQSVQASINGAAVWPLDGAHDVPLRLGNESPNPVPTQDVLTLGTPASVTVAEGQTISATQFTMTDTATDSVVPTQLLTSANDPNFVTPESFIAVIPLAPLSPGATYRVVFSGSTTQFPTGAIQSVNRSWSFTTGSQ